MGDTRISGEVIGIDLGTTFSCVAVARKGHGVEILANDQGNRTTPSYVAFSAATASSERFIGEAAKNQATLNPHRTIFDAKRLIGKKFDDPEVQKDLNYLPYPVVERDGKPCVQLEVNGEPVSFTPEEISAMVLWKMKETAESYLGKQVTNAVVTVPAYFNNSQRQATKDAGIIAGLNVLRIINEPTAGALAYGVNQDPNTKRNILVYDLGGGTFDVSVLEIDSGIFQILATGGDTHLGGGDFDQRVMEHFKEKARVDARNQLERAIYDLKKAVSEKLHMYDGDKTVVEVDYFCEPLTRARFEALNLDLFERMLEIVKSTLKDAKVSKGRIDEIVLVGGSTRIPKVGEMLRKAFDGKEPCNGINPDEAVAYGAAILGANLAGDRPGVGAILFDVTPLSLGIRVHGDLMSIVVPRNTPIPTKKSKGEYRTVKDQQTGLFIEVLQGERARGKDCLLLGSFTLAGIPAAPRGDVRMEVTFEVDADGILTVTAKEEATGKSKSLAIDKYKRNLSSREIERMIREAREMAEHDKKETARVEARNQLEDAIYDLNKAVAAKLHMKYGEVEGAVRETSEWLDNNNGASMQDYKDKSRKLKNLLKKV
ncbi:unnamed protein product [Linum tenue]|uniref:Uncharacterized protein n=1 Tax=Linum tenue TaxID=586396 RepID=A0AAV0HQD7_9ROSI|nr:unnamed protein product [Linum tenue]